MLRISRMSDYAIVLLTTLAHRDAQSRVNARELAAATGISMPTVGKLLKLLNGQDIVDSRQGRSGGYTLARAPFQISLAEIIEAIDGPIAMTDCFRDDHDCGMQDDCRVRPHWGAINHRIRQVLDQTTLAELTEQPPARAESFHTAVPVWHQRN